jgi:excinuclease ABC subunit A
VIDIGPGAGTKGGEVVAQGTPAKIEKLDSLTGKYLSGKKEIAIPEERRSSSKSIEILGAKQFNLKDINVEIPLNNFVCISGVSGSGKSTLLYNILGRALSQHFHDSKAKPGNHKKITGLSNIDKVIKVNQSPIGKTPRSNPATYTGVFSLIRKEFAKTSLAKKRNYDDSVFSFNVKEGRCRECAGQGQKKIEMYFMDDIYVTCPKCKGARYNPEILEVEYKDRNIYQVLNMTVEEAREFFINKPKIRRKLEVLQEVGLGYVALGQPATTLSGGEAQRVKLAKELSRKSYNKTLYILDEPTTGLHSEDIRKLLKIISRLVDRGNSVLVIEHNLDVLKSADWIIDLGPGGGDEGGEIVAQGTPEQIAKETKSVTGQYLKKILNVSN